MDAQHEITEQLAAVRGADDPAAWERLVPLVYAELRAVAHRQLHRERDGHTLSTTALVHEAYLKLANQRHPQWRDRAHFFAIAAMVMRRVLVDHARSYQAARRAGAVPCEAADQASIDVATERAEIFVALDEALDRLAAVDERLARVVEYRFFGGLTEVAIASELGVTERTIRRDWARARAWLAQELEE